MSEQSEREAYNEAAREYHEGKEREEMDRPTFTQREMDTALAAAVQAEREAIKAHIRLSGNLCYERGERRVAYQIACAHMVMAIDARGPTPAVDVLAVVRRFIRATDGRNAAYNGTASLSDLQRWDDELREATAALRSPVDGAPKAEAKDGKEDQCTTR